MVPAKTFDTCIQQNTDLGSKFNWQIWCQEWWKNVFFQSFFLTLFTYNSVIGEHNILALGHSTHLFIYVACLNCSKWSYKLSDDQLKQQMIWDFCTISVYISNEINRPTVSFYLIQAKMLLHVILSNQR